MSCICLSTCLAGCGVSLAVLDEITVAVAFSSITPVMTRYQSRHPFSCSNESAVLCSTSISYSWFSGVLRVRSRVYVHLDVWFFFVHPWRIVLCRAVLSLLSRVDFEGSWFRWYDVL